VSTTRTASASVVKTLEHVDRIGAYQVTALIRNGTGRRITKADLFYRVSKGAKHISDHGSRDGALLEALELAKGKKFLAKFPEAWWNQPHFLFGYEAEHAKAVIKAAELAGCYSTTTRKVS